MARPTAVRIAAATILAATSTVALSAWIGDGRGASHGLAAQLAASATVLAQHGGDREARVVTGERAYADTVAAAERAGATCQTRTGYTNAGREVLADVVSRYSTTRCDLDALGFSIYQWEAGQRPQYGFDRAVPALAEDGASIVVAPAAAGYGQQTVFGDTVDRVAEWGEAALSAQGLTGYDLDCGTHRVGVRETRLDCIATGQDGASVAARVDFARGPLYARVELGDQPVRFE